MGKALNLTDEKFGKLTALFRVKNAGKLTQWMCQCNCSKKTKLKVPTKYLRSGRITDCGCSKKDTTRKIKAKTRKIKTKFHLMGL